MKRCDVCGKETEKESIDFPGTNLSLSGTEISFGVADDANLSDETMSFYKKQMGDYKIGKTYIICWECWLKSLGAKP